MDRQVKLESKLRFFKAIEFFNLNPKPDELIFAREVEMPEPVIVAKIWDEWGLGVKSYSSLVIAGSPRKLL
jgi:hypothetical protein